MATRACCEKRGKPRVVRQGATRAVLDECEDDVDVARVCGGDERRRAVVVARVGVRGRVVCDRPEPGGLLPLLQLGRRGAAHPRGDPLGPNRSLQQRGRDLGVALRARVVERSAAAGVARLDVSAVREQQVQHVEMAGGRGNVDRLEPVGRRAAVDPGHGGVDCCDTTTGKESESERRQKKKKKKM
jgi:N-acetylmuramoyl-L-alanine amidase